jgi:hypothetical protein
LKAINLEKYLFQINTLNTFNKYCKDIFKNEQIKNEIKEQEVKNMYNTAKSFKSFKSHSQDFLGTFKSKIEIKVDEDINKGIDVLRQQILVSAFSIFENYLGHVAKIYLNIFPKMLKKSKNKIYTREIAELKDSEIFQYILEKEIIYFDGLGLKDKKKYLSKMLTYDTYNDLWKLNEKELWVEINEIRNMIVHSDEIVELSEEQFASYLFYFERIMFGMAIYAKYYQGVNIIFAKFNEQIPEKGKPIFKS